jgi:O-acetylhomoserine/O-acetylserine sulfhydrylase-like pyridoxal-dependent enzyme
LLQHWGLPRAWACSKKKKTEAAMTSVFSYIYTKGIVPVCVCSSTSIRLSVGIEDVEDILDDIKQALDKI